jgi:hypothetical protein
MSTLPSLGPGCLPGNVRANRPAPRAWNSREAWAALDYVKPYASSSGRLATGAAGRRMRATQQIAYTQVRFLTRCAMRSNVWIGRAPFENTKSLKRRWPLGTTPARQGAEHAVNTERTRPPTFVGLGRLNDLDAVIWVDISEAGDRRQAAKSRRRSNFSRTRLMSTTCYVHADVTFAPLHCFHAMIAVKAMATG